jgi:hypothetical protein
MGSRRVILRHDCGHDGRHGEVSVLESGLEPMLFKLRHSMQGGLLFKRSRCAAVVGSEVTCKIGTRDKMQEKDLGSRVRLHVRSDM